MNVVIIIPARYKASRFPGKLLQTLGNKTVIQMVYEQALKSRLASEVVVATDDNRIKEEVKRFNGNVIMTSKTHKSGTDRLTEVAKRLNYDVYVNVQGDEPFIKPNDIDKTISILNNKQCDVATLCHPISAEEAQDQNNVKVVFSHTGKVLYFSRLPIPFICESANIDYFKHIGIYAYRKKALLAFSKMSLSDYEKAEKLEQLRYLQNDFEIGISLTDVTGPSIDSPKDINIANSYIANNNGYILKHI